MGAEQSLHTSKTFISVNSEERGKIDDSFTTDPRLEKTWGGTSPQSLIEEITGDVGVVPQKNQLDKGTGEESKGISLVACLHEGTGTQASGNSTASYDPVSRGSSSSSKTQSDYVSEAEQGKWTTRMVRNIPNDYMRQDVLDFLDGMGVQFDFIYLPMDWGRKANLGYAFVNLISPAEAVRIEAVLAGFSNWRTSSDKKCEVVWGKADQQSLLANVDRFRNSPVMHPDVPDEFKPMIFTLGRRTPFPPPTKRIRPPREFQRKNAATAGA